MWVFGLLWAAFAFESLIQSTVNDAWVALLELVVAFFVLAFLVTFSLLSRKKSD